MQPEKPIIKIAKTAYRMGRKDARRYASYSINKARVDSHTVNRFTRMLYSMTCDTPSFDDLDNKKQMKYRIIIREMLSVVSAAILRCLDETPENLVNFEAIVLTAETDNIKSSSQ